MVSAYPSTMAVSASFVVVEHDYPNLFYNSTQFRLNKLSNHPHYLLEVPHYLLEDSNYNFRHDRLRDGQAHKVLLIAYGA